MSIERANWLNSTLQNFITQPPWNYQEVLESADAEIADLEADVEVADILHSAKASYQRILEESQRQPMIEVRRRDSFEEPSALEACRIEDVIDNTAPINCLPNEVLLPIFKWVGEDLVLRAVSRRFKEVIDLIYPKEWKQMRQLPPGALDIPLKMRLIEQRFPRLSAFHRFKVLAQQIKPLADKFDVPFQENTLLLDREYKLLEQKLDSRSLCVLKAFICRAYPGLAPANPNQFRLWLQNSTNLNEIRKMSTMIVFIDTERLIVAPKAIFHMRELRQLELDFGRLTSIPAEIGNLTALRVLKLNNNPLQELPSSIGLLQQLEKLNLSQTRLTQLPDALCSLVNLTSLKLFNTRLTKLPQEFGKLERLRKLHLPETLKSLPESLGNLLNLEDFRLCLIDPKSPVFYMPFLGRCYFKLSAKNLLKHIPQNVLNSENTTISRHPIIREYNPFPLSMLYRTLKRGEDGVRRCFDALSPATQRLILDQSNLTEEEALHRDRREQLKLDVEEAIKKRYRKLSPAGKNYVDSRLPYRNSSLGKLSDLIGETRESLPEDFSFSIFTFL